MKKRYMVAGLLTVLLLLPGYTYIEGGTGRNPESWTFTIECKGAGCDRVESCDIKALAGTSGEKSW